MQPSTGRLPLRRGLALAALATFLVLASIEFVVASLGIAPAPQEGLTVAKPEAEAVLRAYPGTFRASERWLWEPTPGAAADGDRINADGYRGPAYPVARDGKLRIATMGDSSTFGFGFPESDSFSRRLEATLAERGVPAEVLNFGVVGFSAAQGAVYYIGRVRAYRPDVVIAAFGGVNDAVVVPPGMGDVDKLLRLARAPARVHRFLQRFATVRWLDSVLHGSDGAAPVEGFIQSRVPPPMFEHALRSLAAAVADDGGRLLLVSPPRRQDCESKLPTTTEYSRLIVATAAALRVPSIDVRAAFRAREDELAKAAAAAGKAAPVVDDSPLFLDAYHPSVEGHRIYATLLADELARLGWTRPR